MNNAQLNYKFFFQLPKGLQLQSVFEEIQSFLRKVQVFFQEKVMELFYVSLFYRKKNYSKKWTSETLEKDTWSYC